MIRFVISLVVTASLMSCKDNRPTASAQISPNGISYTLLYLPTQEDVSIHVAWPTDWAYHKGNNQAAPHIGVEMVLAAGAEGFSPGEAGERFADLNSEGELYVSAVDHIIGEVTFEKAHLSETVAIANAHLRAPSFDKKWFDRIRKRTEAEIRESSSFPTQRGFDALRWAVLGNSPMRDALSLDDEGVFTKLELEDVRNWHNITFTQSPDRIVVAGGIDAQGAGSAIDLLLQDLPEENQHITREVNPNLSARRILLHDPDTRITNITFLALLPPIRDGGEMEDLLSISALGSDERSLLFKSIRDKLRASYSFGAGLSNFSRDLRIFFMTGEVSPTQLLAVEKAVKQTYQSFVTGRASSTIDSYKAALSHSFTTLPEYVVDLARSELQSALDGYEVGRSLRLSDELSQITEDDILKRLAQVYPRPDEFIVVAVSPDPSALPGACVIKTPQEALDC